MTGRRCYGSPPGTVNRSATVVKLGRRGWVSANLATTVLEIVLQEWLGYTVEIPALSRSPAFWGPSMAEGEFDAEIESWQLKEGTEDYKKYVTVEQVVDPLGPVGYPGRTGLFVNDRLQAQWPMADFYRFWEGGASHYEAAKVPRFGQVNLTAWLGEKFPICGPSVAPWCQTGRLEGYWAPPQCQRRPEECALLLHPTPNENSGYFEQLIRNHNLSIVVAYAGWNSPALVKKLTEEEHKNSLFYWWEPDPAITVVSGKRVAFPDFEFGCLSGHTKEPGGSVRCDYPETLMQKLVRRALKETAPEAYYSVSKLHITQEDMHSIMAMSKAGGGSLEPFEAACAFVKSQEQRLVASMAPACISRPAANPVPGDLVFDPGLMTCVRKTAFPESSTRCLPELPGTVGRKERLIKLARRPWPSHDLASSVLEILLKDYMRYTVFPVNTSALPASNWGPDIEADEYNVDIESWLAQKSTPEYADFVTQRGAVRNPGPVGYPGRSSIFVLPHTMAKSKFANFWRFYASLNQTGGGLDFYHYSDIDLRAMLGSDFPLCSLPQHGWCQTPPYEGWYVPPACSSEPARCVVVFASKPDGGYFEQLTKNLGLPLVHAYVGEDRLQALVRAASDQGKDLLFQMSELDPFPTSVDAVRISYPDHFFGCTAGDTKDPRTGSVACDSQPVALQKLVRSRLREEAPEAFHLLERFSLTAQDMRAMLRNYSAMEPFDIACEWVKANLPRLQADVAPDCLARPKPSEEIRVGDLAFDGAKGSCGIVTCGPNEMLIVVGNSVVCQACNEGQLPNQDQTRCVDCNSGSYPLLVDGAMECVCDAGAQQILVDGIKDCRLCPAGSRADAPVQAMGCPNCTAGMYQDEAGKTACKACGKGSYSPTGGSSSCSLCEQGRFQTQGMQTACQACGPNLMTVVLGADSYDFCRCEEGFFRTGPTGACHPCPKAMHCPAGSDLTNFWAWQHGGRGGPKLPFPTTLSGYMTTVDEPLSVYACASSEMCPGGPPGTCGENLQGVRACSRCLPKHYWDGQECKACSSFETTVWFFPLIPMTMGPIIVIFLYRISRDDTEKWGNWRCCMAAIGLLLVNHVQMTSVVAQADFMYSDILTSSMSFSYQFEDPSSVFRPQCVGVSSFRDTIIMRSAIPVLLLVLVVFTYWGSHALSRFRARGEEGFCRDRTMNVYFSLIFTFFAGLSSMAFTTFKCAQNPNGKATLIADRSVHCYEAEWNGTVAVAFCAVLQILGFAALFSWAAYTAPQRFGEVGFRRRWKFLFIKFRPDVWWWALFFCFRGVLTNVGFIFMQSGFLQIYWVMLVVVCYTFMLVMFAPWRHMSSNTMDIFSCFALNALISLLAFHVVNISTESKEELQGKVDAVAVGLLTLPPIAGGLLLSAAIRTQVHPRSRAELELEFRSLLMSMKDYGDVTEDQAVKILGMLDDWGRWHIMCALRLIGAEVVGMHEQQQRRLIDGNVKCNVNNARSMRLAAAEDFGPGDVQTTSGVKLKKMVV